MWRRDHVGTQGAATLGALGEPSRNKHGDAQGQSQVHDGTHVLFGSDDDSSTATAPSPCGGGKYYDDYSMWDTFRAQIPWYVVRRHAQHPRFIICSVTTACTAGSTFIAHDAAVITLLPAGSP